jgi:hypothetical protein
MSAPPIGDPDSAPNAWRNDAVPVRVPISRISEICAMTEGTSGMNPPDAKPKRTPYAMIAAELLAGIHKAIVNAPDRKATMMIALKRPSLSAANPETTRPTILFKN